MEHAMDERTNLHAEAHLDAARTFAEPWSPRWANPQALLLTGATGFIGLYLLEELLRTTDAQIYCLLRAADAETGASRLRGLLQQHGLWQERFGERIVPVIGDLAQPDWGLCAAEFRALAARIDAVYHNGAWVNALYPYSRLRGVNVDGTRTALRLAELGQTKPFFYVSTLAIFLDQPQGEQSIRETDFPQQPPPNGGYRQSKWVAEALVRQAQARGLPASIYRLGRTLGHSHGRHAGKLDDLLYLVLKSCVLLGQFPAAETTVTLAPVDYVSRAIVYLAQQPANFGKTLHLGGPHATTWEAFFTSVKALGYPLERVPLAAWKTALAAHAAQRPDAPHAQMMHMLSRAPLPIFKPKPTYDTRVAQEALAAASLTCPPLDTALLATYLADLQQCGFLPSPKRATARNTDLCSSPTATALSSST